jgi:hypothetical protein
MSAPLTPMQKDMLRLIKRSRADEFGWYKVSAPIWQLLDPLSADLIERKVDQDGARIKLTERGETVVTYLV